MNIVTDSDALRLAIFKCIQVIDEYQRVDRLGKFSTNPLRGLTPLFIPKDDVCSITLDGVDVIYGLVKWPLKDGELRITDLTFEVSPLAIDTEEIMEFLMIAVVRVLRDFKVKCDAL